MRPTSIIASAFVALVGSLAVMPSSGCASTTSTADPNIIKCTPGNYVFCRCQNRAEGTKLCNEDGHSFGKCDPCETEDNPGLPDDPNNPPPEVDGGQDDVTQPPAATCGDKMVQDGEDCDDGNNIEDDGCDSSCKLSGSNPLASRSCPGLETHVWAKSVMYVGTTLGSTNTGSAKPTCTSTMGGNPTTGAAGPDRVFKVVAHKTGKLTVTTSDTNYDSFVYVTDNCAPAVSDGSLSYLACSNNTNGVGGETLSIPVTAGKSYSVLVDGAGISQQQGAFRVTFAIQ